MKTAMMTRMMMMRTMATMMTMRSRSSRRRMTTRTIMRSSRRTISDAAHLKTLVPNFDM